MSERFSKTSSLSTGSSWHLFAENIAFEESDASTEGLEKSAETTRLHVEDTSLFGVCPARTFLQLVTCKLCQKVLNASSLIKHYDVKHNKFLSSVKPSPPKRCIPLSKPPPPPNHIPSKVSFSKSKVLKSGSGKQVIRIEETVDPNDKNVKIEEVPLTIPNFTSVTSKSRLPKIMIKTIDSKNTTIKAESSISPTGPTGSSQICINVKGTTKKIPQLKEKEYDPDKQCGVWIPELERNCTRSLTCKTHPLSLRRQVIGRCKDFDILLAEHRARITLKAQENNAAANSVPAPSPKPLSRDVTPVNSPYGYDKIVFPSVPLQSTTNYKKDGSKSHRSSFGSLVSPDSLHEQPVILNCISDDLKSSNSLHTIARHPKPIKVNLFGSRQTECKCRVYSRRMDHFRNATASMLQRFKNTTTSRSKTSLKDASKMESEGIYAALQDPLQNGIIHKQKNSVKSNKLLPNTVGSKRHLSLNELQQQGILADGFSAASATKRRNPSTTDITLVSPNQYLNRSVSNPPEPFDKIHINKSNEFLKPTDNTPANLSVRRSKSVNSFLNAPYDISSSTAGYVVNAQNNFIPNSLTTQQTLNSINIPTPPSKIITTNSLTNFTVNSSKTISPAPNVTITQGMLVSLPAAMFQQNASTAQNMYTLSTQNKDLVTTCSVSTLSSPTVQSPARHYSGKKATFLLHQNQQTPSIISPQANGITNAHTPATTPVLSSQDYSINLTTNSTDNQQLAPNITVTASHSLSGVLQGVTVGGTNTVNRLKSTTFKTPVNSVFNDHRNQLSQQQQQQLIMPIQANATRVKSEFKEQPLKSPFYSPQSTQAMTQQQFQQQLQQNYTTLPIDPTTQTFINNIPNNVVNSNQNIQQQQNVKQYRKLPNMQQNAVQQHQMQSQHFITMHGGYQQQILPKLSTVPQVISQYHNQPFAQTQNTQRGVQFIQQSNNSSTLQQQHGGALS